MTDSGREHPAAVRLSGLTKRFPGFQLGPVDLVLEPGTVLALVGPNGAGKTTTLNCMAGLIVPEEGNVEVYGLPVHPTRTEYRRDVGYVGEESGFFKRWTTRRNLDYLATLLPGWSLERARKLVERFALPMDKPVGDLSRGNRTKLALVAALGYGPRLLLLDEPTAGLDPVVRSEVLDVLWETTEDGGHAVLYSTHVLSDISRLADELAFLRDGQIVLRSGRDALSERWRRISFRLLEEDVELAAVVEHRRVRSEHQVITRDAEATLEQLAELGAEALEVARMSVDEIAVQILKEGHHVARAEN
ncbi:MAG: ABC transporter ATP-binding protein [Acidobacteriota bacterium]|nr:ABC transporter ATP-binding protein [Acidobacteriota bacterium]